MRCLALSGGVTGILCWLLSIYWLILFVRIISSWFPPPSTGPLRTILRICFELTDPVLRPLRSLIPPIRAGMMAIDLSPIIVLVVARILQSSICG